MARQDNDDRPETPSEPALKEGLPALPPDEIFALLYAEYPHKVSRDVSRRERKDNDYVALSLVYGEIAFEPFKMVLDQLKRTNLALTRPGGAFLDIGSGSGKAVFAAALAHDFDACYGIEILEGLHGISQNVLHTWERVVKKQYSLSIQKKRMRIYFTHADALAIEWPVNPQPDVVFMNSTCFGSHILKEFARKLASYSKAGSIVITATYALPDTQNFEHVRTISVEQEAWGQATWFVHRKK